MLHKFCSKAAALGLSVGLISSSALAGVSQTVLSLQASNASGSGSLSISWSQGLWNSDLSTFSWSQSVPMQIVDSQSGASIATLNSAAVTLRMSPNCQMDVNCAFLAGSSETTLVISSPLVSFDAIDSSAAQARASASFTLTDVNLNGATLRATGTPGSGAFKAYVNGSESGGALFAQLVSVMSTTGGTTIASQSDPFFGYRSVGSELHSLYSQMSFTLTAGDSVSCVTSMAIPQAIADPCGGDLNGDSRISLSDVSLFMASFAACEGQPGYEEGADMNGDGCIDLQDLTDLLAAYGSDCQ